MFQDILVLLVVFVMGMIVHEAGHAIVARSFGYEVEYYIGLPRPPRKRILIFGVPVTITPWLIGAATGVKLGRGVTFGRRLIYSSYGFTTQTLFVLLVVCILYKEQAWVVFSALAQSSFNLEGILLLLAKLGIGGSMLTQSELTHLISGLRLNDLVRLAELIDGGEFGSRATLAGLSLTILTAFWNMVPFPGLDGWKVFSLLVKSALQGMRRTAKFFRELVKSAL